MQFVAPATVVRYPGPMRARIQLDRPTGGRLAPRHTRAALAALLASAALACAAPSPRIPNVGPGSGLAPPPAWSRQALTWGKLESIERWLNGPGPGAWPAEIPGADLQLAEGRVEFAARDRGQVPAEALGVRLAAAEAGFRRVLTDPLATFRERADAESGIRTVRSLFASAPTTGLVLISRSDWGARKPVASRLTPHRGAWKRITLHHSAEHSSALGRSSRAEVAETLQKIQRYHMEQTSERYGDIGYHFLIDPAGRVYVGRSLSWRGAHAGGSNNIANIGVCLLGDFTREPPKRAALASLARLLGALRERHSIRPSGILGHGELKATACPGTALARWVSSYRLRTNSPTAAQ